MRTQRAIHGRPKSAKVRCLCLAAQHMHRYKRLCNTVYPACDGEPGGGWPLCRLRDISPVNWGDFGHMPAAGLLTSGTTLSVSALRRYHLLQALRPLKVRHSLSSLPSGETGAQRQWGCSASPSLTSMYAPAKNNPWAPQKRKSALSMPRGTTHALYARLCNTVYPACDGEPGGPGGPITLSSPPGGLFPPLFARTKSGASQRTYLHMSARCRRVSAPRNGQSTQAPRTGKAARRDSGGLPAGEGDDLIRQRLMALTPSPGGEVSV